MYFAKSIYLKFILSILINLKDHIPN